jgi:hypothetical protein
VVEGHVPDGCRLLLHAELPARYRGTRRRRGVTAGHAADRAAHAVRDAADVPPGGGGEPLRAGLGGDAGAAAAVLEGQVLRAVAARLRLHVLDHHDHAVRRRRHGALRREPLRPEGDGRSPGAAHGRAAADPRRGVPGRVLRGRRRRGAAGARVPGAEPRGRRGRCRERRRAPGGRGALGGRAARRRRPRSGRARGRTGVPAAGAGSLGVRDRRVDDAPDPRRR